VACPFLGLDVGIVFEGLQVRMDDVNDQNGLRRSPKDGRKSLFTAIPGWKQAIVSGDKSTVYPRSDDSLSQSRLGVLLVLYTVSGAMLLFI
jgi:hypothetical protein